MIELGIVPLSAHMFVLYFGMMSMITPPVAIAAFVAANMAGAHPMRTGFEAVLIGWPAYVVPFLFVLSPNLLLAGGWAGNLYAAVAATAGVFLGTIAVVGYFQYTLGPAMRLAFALAGLALLMPDSLFQGASIMNAVGFIAGMVLLIFARIGARKQSSS